MRTNRLLLALVCILIAVILWLLSVLNKKKEMWIVLGSGGRIGVIGNAGDSLKFTTLNQNDPDYKVVFDGGATPCPDSVPVDGSVPVAHYGDTKDCVFSKGPDSAPIYFDIQPAQGEEVKNGRNHRQVKGCPACPALFGAQGANRHQLDTLDGSSTVDLKYCAGATSSSVNVQPGGTLTWENINGTDWTVNSFASNANPPAADVCDKKEYSSSIAGEAETCKVSSQASGTYSYSGSVVCGDGTTKTITGATITVLAPKQ